MKKHLILFLIFVFGIIFCIYCGGDDKTKPEEGAAEKGEPTEAEISAKPDVEANKELKNNLELLSAAGKNEDIISTSRNALTENPDNPVAHYYLGEANLKTGDLNQSESSLKKSLDNYKAEDNIDGQIESYNMLGKVNFYQGNYKEAARNFQSAYELATENDTKVYLDTVYKYLGAINLYLRDFNKALDYHQKALQVAKETDDAEGKVNALNNMGIVYRHQKQYGKAIQSFKDANEANNELNDLYLKASIINNLGITLLLQDKKKNADKSKKLFEGALQLCEKLNWKVGIAECTHNLGLFYSLTGKNRDALKKLNEAANMYSNIGYTKGLKTSYLELSRLYAKVGNKKEAEKYQKKNYELKKKIVKSARKAKKVELKASPSSDDTETLE